jgi:hypothetical protein
MAVKEALFFHGRLVESKMPLAGFVINRIRLAHPASADAETVAADLAKVDSVAALSLSEGGHKTAAEALLRAHAEQEKLAAADALAVNAIRDAAGELPVAEVPEQVHDVHQIERLAELGAFLLPPRDDRVG